MQPGVAPVRVDERKPLVVEELLEELILDVSSVESFSVLPFERLFRTT